MRSGSAKNCYLQQGIVAFETYSGWGTAKAVGYTLPHVALKLRWAPYNKEIFEVPKSGTAPYA